MDQSAEIVVIGAGLAGLAAAAYLGRSGRRVTVVDVSFSHHVRAPTPSRQRSG